MKTFMSYFWSSVILLLSVALIIFLIIVWRALEAYMVLVTCAL